MYPNETPQDKFRKFEENFSVSEPLDITRSTDLIDLFIKTDLKTVLAYFRIH